MTTPQIDPAACLALADRIEAGGSGPAIDAEIAIVAGDNDHEKLVVDRGLLYFHDPIRRIRCRWQAQPVTTSLDASDALRQRLLPGWDVVKISGLGDAGAVWSCELYNVLPWEKDDYDPLGMSVSGQGPTEAQARTAAILRALAATQGDDR